MNRCLMVAVAVFGSACAGACASPEWPAPPPIEAAAYRAQYDAWRDEQQQTAEFSLRIAGIIPVPPGETPFGDGAGVLTRAGDEVVVTPATGVALTYDGSGAAVTPKSAVALYETQLALGSRRFQLVDMGEDTPRRLFLMTMETASPATIPPIDTYPLDQRWRLTARFTAFESPRRIVVPDVRGGQVPLTAVGTLTFRIGDREQRLTAFGEPGGSELATLFKDATNETTTYRGYRIVRATRNGEWAVIDFNQAGNPPCAYSPYTTCPLPPPENRLDVAVEAGEKRHPAAKS